MLHDVSDKVHPVFKKLLNEPFGIGLVYGAEGRPAYVAIGYHTHNALGNDDAPFAAAPVPVDKDLRHRLTYNFVGPPTVPVEMAEHFEHIVACLLYTSDAADE